ncbi:MAG TPA: PIG-L family deacetylase [Solirubrobacteraceae bacterium]|jgi:LmbE family N-acetylglucosaminyl deacetylase
MDLRRASRAPTGIARRFRSARRLHAERRFQTALRFDATAPSLLLSPHWDDAVFDCWALLSSADDLTVVNVFAGEPGAGRLTRWDRVTGASDSNTRARERIAEDDQALAQAGRSAVNLPLLDAEYREPGPAPSLSDIDRALIERVQLTSRVYAPAGLGTNADHKLVRWYARALVNFGIPVSLYADLPYCVVHGWPHWVDGSKRDPHRDVDAFWLTFLTDVPELAQLRDAQVERLDDERAAAKLAAMRAYSTQFSSLDSGAAGVLSNPAIHRFEVLWDLDRASTSSDRGRPTVAARGVTGLPAP